VGIATIKVALGGELNEPELVAIPGKPPAEVLNSAVYVLLPLVPDEKVTVRFEPAQAGVVATDETVI